MITKELNGIPFNAQFAAEHNKGKKIYELPGVDGFVFDSKPLNSVSIKLCIKYKILNLIGMMRYGIMAIF